MNYLINRCWENTTYNKENKNIKLNDVLRNSINKNGFEISGKNRWKVFENDKYLDIQG